MKLKTIIINDLNIELIKLDREKNGLMQKIYIPTFKLKSNLSNNICQNYDYYYYIDNKFYENCSKVIREESLKEREIDLTLIYLGKELDIKKLCQDMLDKIK